MPLTGALKHSICIREILNVHMMVYIYIARYNNMDIYYIIVLIT